MAVEKFGAISEVIVKYSRRPVYILMATMLAGLIAITILAVLAAISMNPPTKYLLVIDCGLSVCKFSLFEYTDWHGRTNAWIHQRSYYSISPGTSFFVDNPKVAADAIVQEADAVITRGVPTDHRKDTRIFLGAVEGVRMLEKTSPEKVQALLEALRNALAGSASEGVVVSKMEDVRVVSGPDEGIYAWLAVNYLMGNFIMENSESRFRLLPMLGALNLGEASTQMTLMLSAEEALHESGMNVMAFGQSYNLSSHSHLCYGVDTIQARYLAFLTQGADLQHPVASPCHQSGLSIEVASDDIFQAPCIISTGEDIMGPSILRPSGAPTKIAFRGDYDATTCGQTIEAIFANGSFADFYRPRLRGSFVGIHKLWEIVTSFKRANQSVKVTLTEFATAIERFCTSSWTTLSPWEQVTSRDKCLQGWIVRRLLEAYGFRSDSDWNTIIFLGGVGGTVASWSTGYALDATGRIPSTAPAIRMNLLGFIVGIAIFLDIFVMSLFLLIARCCKKPL